MNNREQDVVNFDSSKENLENTHEIFTNLPNNTLNGVNPIGIEPKNEYVDKNIQPAINFDETMKMKPIDDQTNEIKDSFKENEKVVEPSINVDTVVDDGKTNNKIKKKVKIVCILCSIFLIVGGISSGLLLMSKKDLKPSNENKVTNEANGNSGIETNYTVVDVTNELGYINDSYTNNDSDNILKTVKYGNDDVLNIMKNGMISISNSENYKTISFENKVIKYFYSFYENYNYYIISDEGILYQIVFLENDDGTLNYNEYEVSVVSNDVKTIKARYYDSIRNLYEVVVIYQDGTSRVFDQILGVDESVTNIKR